MNSGRSLFFLLVVVCMATLTFRSFGQTETATISGRVTDQQGAILVGADVVITNVDTNLSSRQATNKEGLYVLPGLKPGHYRMTVTNPGFRTVNLTDVVLNVQDSFSQNFKLQVGSVSESITIVADEATVNTEWATVSTVVDRNFAENLPMNGRSFQTLIQLTPGVVVTPTSPSEGGQFSISGQRPSSNYWMVDGVSANIGVSSSTGSGNGLSGSLGSFSALGGTNSLVSVDALQEFRIQTSTYAPEFGRTPGGQISIVTRSGTNQFHGTLFDYFRNDVLDASDWFNGYTNNPALPKAQERQNDFGGIFSGPIFKGRTFFFFSYEGLRLRLPQTTLTAVPDVSARQSPKAGLALQPYLNAYPLPNGPQAVDSQGNPIPDAAQFNESYSNPATLDAYSLRIDHKLSSIITFFGRYNYSPSDLIQRGPSQAALSTLARSAIKTQTLTAGTSWAISSRTLNDLRFNYSRTDSSSHSSLDSFGGASPLTSPPFPDPFSEDNSLFVFGIRTIPNGSLRVGYVQRNLQRQVNIVDSLTLQKSSHRLKFGVDFRRLSPLLDPQLYGQQVFFTDVPSAESGSLNSSVVTAGLRSTLLFRNLGAFAQDTWLIFPRLTITYGVRWDVDFSPSSLNGPSLLAVTGFNLNDTSSLAVAPAGTPPFQTTYGNVAPRVGMAYELFQNQNWGTVLRGGFGVFYDLATQEVGNAIFGSTYPFGATKFPSSSSFPLDPVSASPPPITVAELQQDFLNGFDPHLKLPHTLEWNVALEQALARQQSVSLSYVGSAGRRLLQPEVILFPNPNFLGANLFGNTGTSDYHALELQFQRRFSHGLQALASYTWSHSIDTGSAGSIGNTFADARVPATANRGPSAFDIRHSFSAGVTYDVPILKINTFADAILRGWSIQNVFLARSASPVDVSDTIFSFLHGNFLADVRPDVVSGVPLYLTNPNIPGGKQLNKAAFRDPPIDPNTGAPLRQGNLGRNALRGFGAFQWDFALHRDFPLHESLKIQFRAEMFNVLNHPNFGPPVGDLNNPQFGLSTMMLGQSLGGGGGNVGTGSLSPLYQFGGPRSIQLALKLQF